MPGIAVTHPACPARRGPGRCLSRLGCAQEVQLGEWALHNGGKSAIWGRGKPPATLEAPGSKSVARRWGWHGHHPNFPRVI